MLGERGGHALDGLCGEGRGHVVVRVADVLAQPDDDRLGVGEQLCVAVVHGAATPPSVVPAVRRSFAQGRRGDLDRRLGCLLHQIQR